MKLLIVTSRFPYPIQKGDKLRIYHQIKELSKYHEIYLFALNNFSVSEADLNELKPYCKGIKVYLFGKITPIINTIKSCYNLLPFQVNMFINKKSEAEFIKYVRKIQPDHIYCQLIRTAEYGKLFPTIPKTLDYMDCFSSNMQSRKQKAPFILRPFFNLESRRLINYETKIAKHFNSTTLISELDKEKINSNSSIILNGVDINYFKPKPQNKDIDLLFVGNMNYPPNIDTCEYIANKIVPKLLKTNVHLKVVFAGTNPHKKVKKLENNTIEVTGWVNDMRDYYNRAHLFLAPMTLGTGLQNKILEAMAMKVPVITSTHVNKAINANKTQIIECNELNEYVFEINNLLNNLKKQELLRENASCFVHNNYSWHTHTKKLSQLFLSNT